MIKGFYMRYFKLKHWGLNGWLLLVLALMSALQLACKKDLFEANINTVDNSITLTANLGPDQGISLSEQNSEMTLLILKWSDPGYFTDTARGNVIISYILDLDTSASFGAGKSYNLGVSLTSDSLTGLSLNNKLLAIGCTPSSANIVYTRIRSVFNGDTLASNTISFTATPYALPLPALLIMGEGGWTTPATRTNGYLLTSAKKDNKYEGYINFSYANWGGANCKLLSTVDNSGYGWGTDAYTLQKGADISTLGNLWITPCPNYMKVNVDLDALTISYTPIKFFMSGTFNNWGNSAMTFDANTNKWTATGVKFAAGDSFAFVTSVWDNATASWNDPSWDICYKIDEEGTLVFAGDPVWGGNNITVAQTGTYTVSLDLSNGDGNYSFEVIKD